MNRAEMKFLRLVPKHNKGDSKDCNDAVVCCSDVASTPPS